MDLMIDIETLGTKYNSVVTQIGAIYFDRNNGIIDNGICLNISIDDCLKNGLVVDSGALKFWWENIPSWLNNPVPIGKAVHELNNYCKKATAVWSHSTFDIPILANMCSIIGQKKLPFPYKICRDIRTLQDLSRIKVNKKEQKIEKTHNALEDCKYQVEYCIKYFNIISKEGGNEKN